MHLDELEKKKDPEGAAESVGPGKLAGGERMRVWMEDLIKDGAREGNPTN